MILAIDNADALGKYYKLLLCVVRVIVSVVMSRGSQNQQTIDQAKQFLAENRSIIVAVFKRQARIGTAAESFTIDVEELVEFLVLLMTMTGFIDVSQCGDRRDEKHADSPQFEDQRDAKRSRRKAFT